MQIYRRLSHKVQTVTVNSGFVVGGFASSAAYRDTDCNVSEDVRIVAAPLLQRSLILIT